MRLVTVKVPEIYLEGIDELVRLGRYSSRSEVIRTALRDLLRKELWMSDNELDKLIRNRHVYMGVRKVKLS
jgi:Arc/MetJ-type ribon-helix-helix transcriptional regulator